MLEDIKVLKREYLVNVQNKKSAIEGMYESLVASKYAEKKKANDEKGRELDAALTSYISQEQAALNERITAKRQAVIDKKKELDERALEEARTEASAEIGLKTVEYAREIAAVEKEIG